MRYVLVAAVCLGAAVSVELADLSATQAPAAKPAAAAKAQPAKAPSAPIASHPKTTPVASAPAVPVVSATANRELLDKFCVGCHNQRSKTAGIMFDTLDLAQVTEHADVWEKTIRKLRAGMMPPPGAR